MRVPDSDEEQPLAWSAVLAYTPVYSADGDSVGILAEVLGSQAEDIFHGLVVNLSEPARQSEIAAADVRSITNRRIDIGLTTEEVRALPVYRDEPTFRLKVSGRKSDDIEWTDDRDRGPK